MADQGYIFPSSRQSGELSAIRKDLNLKGYSLIEPQSQIDWKTAKKIRQLLHQRPFCAWSALCFLGGVAPDIQAYRKEDRDDTYKDSVTVGWSVWKQTVLSHGEISEEEINQFYKDIFGLANEVGKTIVQAETTAKEKTNSYQNITLHSIYICTDRRWNCSPIGGHRHYALKGTDSWVSATVSVFGPGTWFETGNKQHGKQERAVALPGQVLLLSEARRNEKLSLTNELVFHGAPDLPYERLILLLFYNDPPSIFQNILSK